jgi:hypothetical protein
MLHVSHLQDEDWTRLFCVVSCRASFSMHVLIPVFLLIITVDGNVNEDNIGAFGGTSFCYCVIPLLSLISCTVFALSCVYAAMSGCHGAVVHSFTRAFLLAFRHLLDELWLIPTPRETGI